MSTVFSKNKEKRSRSSSNEANNSFVKNVTSRVSGLLPATIAKWFGSPSSSNANGSAPAAEGTDSSTEDEAPESPVITQPPSKRMRFSPPGKYNHFGTTDPNCVPSNIDTIEQITPYPNIQSPPGRNTFRRETNFVSTPVRAPNEETVIERSDRDSTMLKSQHSVSNVGPSVATKRKSLFDNSSSSKEASLRALRTTASNTMVDPKAPCFKPSLFGSPFYPGHTMYGGASMYINQPNIKQRKTALVNESTSSENSTMSQSARRVMDLLENYSSPLIEAKRISQYVKNSGNETLDRSTTSVGGSPYSNKVLSYKTQELHVPNIATILRLKQRSRLMDTTNAARQIIASHSSTMPEYIQPYPKSDAPGESETDSSSKLTTKVKTRLTRQNRGESINMEESLQPVNLPTAVLQIDKDNLPKFTFGNVAKSNVTSPTSNSFPKPTFASSTPARLPLPGSNTSVKIGVLPLSKPESVFANDSYKFSSPVRISNDPQEVSSTLPKFTFGSPERGIDKPNTDKNKDDDSSAVISTPKPTEKITAPKSNNWQCPDCWVHNKPDVNSCACCGAKHPSKELAKASKCTICKLSDSKSNSEKCVSCDKTQSNKIMPVLQSVDLTKWKCEDCWVSNDENVNKCVCCGAKNPNPSKPANASKPTSSIVSSIASSDWKCDDCWIKNKSGVDKCAACGANRPGSKPSSVSALPSFSGSSVSSFQDNNLKNMVKSQNDKWECPSCLVRNENNRTKCVCCESSKPGAAKEDSLSQGLLDNKKTFNFGMTTNTSFKFGIDPKPQEAGSVKMPEAKPAETLNKLEESETNNNVLPKTPSFSFGIPAKKTDDKDEAAKGNKITETTKISGFTFGVPKAVSKTEITTTATAIFGSTAKLSDLVTEKTDMEKEKPQEVPKIDFKFPVAKESPKPALFGLPVNSQENKEKPAAPATLLNPLVNTERKDTLNTNLIADSKATSESAPQKTFTFTGIGSTPNLFATPASTTSTFSNPVQSTPTPAVSIFPKPDATAAPALSMFQKPDVATTSTISLFQKSETITTTAPPSLGATAPIFSFGSNSTQSAAPPAFGVSNPQSTAPPAFGSSTAQNTTPQTFGGNGIQSATPTFGASAQSPAPQAEKPKFNFTFGGGSTPLFNNTNSFSAAADNKPNTNTFGITGNSLGGNGLSGVNPLGGGTGIGPAKLPGSNDLNAGNEMAATPNLFGAPAKENLWSSTNNTSTNLFVTSAATNPLQKPATFTFGSSTPFNANNTTPAFGSNPAPAQNLFGMNQNTNAQPSLFSTPVQNQPAPSLFGGPQQTSNPSPAMNLFGSPNVGATPTFGSPNPSIPSFEAPSVNPAPAPAFNFGSSQVPGVFGFGQQQQQQQPQMPQQPGVYSFGGAPSAPQVQFNMGSAPANTNATGARRFRKAVRRNPQR